MVKELASLKNLDAPGHVPYGLIEFLVRLAQEEVLREPVEKWIGAYAANQASDVATAFEKLNEENGQKLLMVELEADDTGALAAFHPYLRTSKSEAGS